MLTDNKKRFNKFIFVISFNFDNFSRELGNFEIFFCQYSQLLFHKTLIFVLKSRNFNTV